MGPGFLWGIGARSSAARKLEYLLIAIGFPAGLLFLLDFLLPGRRLRDWRQATTTLLGALLLSNATLNLYAIAHDDMQYSPYLDAFHVARRLLTAAAILIIVTVVLPAKKKQNKTETDTVRR